MGIQIALAWSKATEKELVKMGFKKREVYVKNPPPGCMNTMEQNKAGDREFFSMNHPPYQFVTTSWWGAGE